MCHQTTIQTISAAVEITDLCRATGQCRRFDVRKTIRDNTSSLVLIVSQELFRGETTREHQQNPSLYYISSSLSNYLHHVSPVQTAQQHWQWKKKKLLHYNKNKIHLHTHLQL